MSPRSWAAAGTAAVLTLVLAACGDANTGGDAAMERPPSSTTSTSGAASSPVTADDVPVASSAVLSPVPPPPTATAARTPSVAPPPGSTAGFVWEVASVTAADLPHSWRQGCPVGPDALRAVTVGYHAMDGGVRTGVLVISSRLVEPARRAFLRLFEIGFPITSIRPVDDFGGSDDASMAADNTSGFNCRAAVSNGPTSWSNHAYGRAIDINPLINPYILDGKVLPPEGARYADRRGSVPGMITAGSEALKAFTRNGFTWGGTWSNPDYQHMER